MKPHGNSKKSKRPHHLYAIEDREKKTTFKYGICGRPLNKDGSSPRANEQVNLFNRVAGWLRFFASILLKDISGRTKAEEIESAYIDEYEAKHGKKPDGNP